MVDVGETDVEVGQVATLLGDPAKGDPGVGEWSAALGRSTTRSPAASPPPRVHHRAGRPALACAIQEAFG